MMDMNSLLKNVNDFKGLEERVSFWLYLCNRNNKYNF